MTRLSSMSGKGTRSVDCMHAARTDCMHAAHTKGLHTDEMHAIMEMGLDKASSLHHAEDTFGEDDWKAGRL